MATKKRTELSLELKVKLIKSCAGKSQRQLSSEFGIGKTQVQCILKRKAELLEAYEDCASPSRKRARYANEHEDIDDLTWRWFQRARSMNAPLSGPLIQEQARTFAKQLKKSDFKASNGWLTRFKNRHSIAAAVMSGERASVDQGTVDSWLERLPSIIEGYAPCDIFNMDETGVFYRALPDKTLAVKGSDCAGGKKSKDRITLAACVNAVGEFERPLVIGHAANPRCFKKTNADKLPVTWVSNKKAWMTSVLFTDWITQFNKRMRHQKRHVLLFLDNAPSHPQGLKLSNVNVRFLPSNTTSVLQPLDLGIIKTIKSHYRTKLLRSVLAKLHTTDSASDVAKSVTVLDACSWLAGAMKQVKPETVVKCFAKAGIVPPTDSDSDDEDFYLEDELPLSALVSSVSDQLNIPQSLSAREYTDMDNDAPATEELQEGWEKELAEEFLSENNSESSESVDEPDSDQESQPELSIKSLKDAMHWINQLKLFATEHGHCSLSDLSQAAEKLEKTFVDAKLKSSQKEITSFFQPT